MTSSAPLSALPDASPDASPDALPQSESETVEFKTSLAAHIEPRLYPEITSINVAGKTCLRVQATGHQKPYFAHGRACRFERPSAAVETTPETGVTTPETAQTTPETADPRQKNTKERLVQLLREQPQFSAPAIAAALGIGKDGVKYHLNQLNQAGKLRRVGPTKGGRWQITEPDSKGNP